jgi:gas vesicle protein
VGHGLDLSSSKRTFAFIKSSSSIVKRESSIVALADESGMSLMPDGPVQPDAEGVACNVPDTTRHSTPGVPRCTAGHGVENPRRRGFAMAILERIRDRNGVAIDFGELADQARDHAPDTSGIDAAAWASDTANGMTGAAKDVAGAAKDAAKDVAGAAKGAMKDASDNVKDASDTARERLETVADLIREAIREWNRTTGDRRMDARLDEIAHRLRGAMPASQFKGAVARLERELPDTDKNRYDRAFERGRTQARTMYVVGGVAIGIGAGIAAAILLDPQRGAERRAQMAKFRDRIARQASERSRELATRAKSMAAERGIGAPANPTMDPTGVTTGRQMVPVMPVGDDVVTDPSSIIREPLPGTAGGIEPEVQTIAEPSTADGTGDRAVTASHG